MKAKEYATRYHAASDDEKPKAAAAVFTDMLLEVKEITEQRNVKSTAAYCAVIDELEAKWKAFRRLAGPELIAEGFSKLLAFRFPEAYAVWVREKDRRPQRLENKLYGK